MKFASSKTQLLVVSTSRTALHLTLEGEVLLLRDEITVLEVTYNHKFTVKHNIERLGRDASRKISLFLDVKCLEILYKAQVRFSKEYSYLAWGKAASAHLSILDKVHARAVKLIMESSVTQELDLQSLQHRRDVADLTVMLKVHQH